MLSSSDVQKAVAVILIFSFGELASVQREISVWRAISEFFQFGGLPLLVFGILLNALLYVCSKG